MFQLNRVVWGNTVIVWGVVLALAVGLTAALLVGRLLFLRWLSAPSRWRDSPWDRVLATLAQRFSPFVMGAVAASLAGQVLTLPHLADKVLSHLGPLALLVQAGLWADGVVAHYLGAPAEDATPRFTVLGFMVRVLVWSLALLAALGVLGFNITTLLASLGIGGVAVALAVQNILADLFASISITMDKPFEVGDFIKVEDFLGPVEFVGLKTTRVRSLSGEQIIFSNTDLLKSRIRNFKRMAERRVLFTFGLAYGLDPDGLERIPGQVREIIEAQPRTRFDRAHLREFTETALVFEVVYYVLDPDYNLYMDIQQTINFGLFRGLRAGGAAFAYPRRVIEPIAGRRHRDSTRMRARPALRSNPAQEEQA
jgi:small-conductance mechanosensitive channel